MHDKIISTMLILYGLYLAIIGYLNLKKNKKILSVLELVDLHIVKFQKGIDAYENRKKDLLETSKHKIFAKNFFFLGILSIGVGLILLLQ